MGGDFKGYLRIFVLQLIYSFLLALIDGHSFLFRSLIIFNESRQRKRDRQSSNRERDNPKKFLPNRLYENLLARDGLKKWAMAL